MFPLALGQILIVLLLLVVVIRLELTPQVVCTVALVVAYLEALAVQMEALVDKVILLH
jgi:hypothetical protein